MELFTETFDKVRTFVHEKGTCRSWVVDAVKEWPAGGSRNIVLADEVEVELGNPRVESVSCILWTENTEKVRDTSITLIGPDIPESKGKSLPFGKVVLVAVNGCNEENTYERYREMERVRHALDLKGYMMKAASQYQREWSRISKQALAKGFSFETLGNALVKQFKEKDYVRGVELIFLTSSTQDIKELKEITSRAAKMIGAMNKMAQEISSACDSCEYNDVCADVNALKGMRDTLQKDRGGQP
jgi:CO dehydrogenase/acetyl-CoA synthase beta subunit